MVILAMKIKNSLHPVLIYLFIYLATTFISEELVTENFQMICPELGMDNCFYTLRLVFFTVHIFCAVLHAALKMPPDTVVSPTTTFSVYVLHYPLRIVND